MKKLILVTSILYFVYYTILCFQIIKKIKTKKFLYDRISSHIPLEGSCFEKCAFYMSVHKRDKCKKKKYMNFPSVAPDVNIVVLLKLCVLSLCLFASYNYCEYVLQGVVCDCSNWLRRKTHLLSICALTREA